MARPHSDGLEYFEHDVDASNDEKIESMEALYGAAGYAFYFKMAERIYRAGGALVVSAAETRQILARKCLCTVEEWDKMLASALRIELFDAEIYSESYTLTSHGIQKRCRKVFDKREKMAQKYRNRVSDAETPPETPPVEESRGEESRGKKRRVKTVLAHVDPQHLPPGLPDPPNLQATLERINPKRKTKSLIPEDWAIPEEVLAWCAEKRLPEPEFQLPMFINHFQSKGEARADWSATFRNWMLSPYRKDRINGSQNGGGGRPGNSVAQRNNAKLTEQLGKITGSTGDGSGRGSQVLHLLSAGDSRGSHDGR